MMREIPESEATARLPELLAAAEQGETVAITRDGYTVARIVPAVEPVPMPPAPQPWGKIPEDYETRRQLVEDFRRRRAERKSIAADAPQEPISLAPLPELQPTLAELRAETPEENYQRWLEARGPISEGVQEFLDWRSYGRG